MAAGANVREGLATILRANTDLRADAVIDVFFSRAEIHAQDSHHR